MIWVFNGCKLLCNFVLFGVRLSFFEVWSCSVMWYVELIKRYVVSGEFWLRRISLWRSKVEMWDWWNMWMFEGMSFCVMENKVLGLSFEFDEGVWKDVNVNIV